MRRIMIYVNILLNAQLSNLLICLSPEAWIKSKVYVLEMLCVFLYVIYYESI